MYGLSFTPFHLGYALSSMKAGKVCTVHPIPSQPNFGFKLTSS